MGLTHLTENDLAEIFSARNQITAPLLTATANNYNPTGFGPGVLVRQNINVNNRVITGLVAPPAGVDAIVGICNINTGSLDIRFAHNDSGSLAANRFLIRDNTNKSIKPNETAIFWYDHTSNRWRPYNRVG